MTISFIIEERQIDSLYNNEFSEKWFDYRTIRPELKKDLSEIKPHTYPVILSNGCTLNGFALVQACKADGIAAILCRVIQEDIPENDLPDLVVSLNNQRNKKSWEQCEIALHFLPKESQQGKSNGGRTKWEIAKERSHVTVSSDTIKEYYHIKEWVATHPGDNLLEKVKSQSPTALAIRTAYQNVIQKRNQEDARAKEAERLRRKEEQEAKRKNEEQSTEASPDSESPETSDSETERTIRNEEQEARQKDDEEKSDINFEPENPETTSSIETWDQTTEAEPPMQKPRLALSEHIAVADPSHFTLDNINLWLRDNTQPWELKTDELIRLTVISPPYFNQRNYRELGLYTPQKLPQYLKSLYDAMENVKKHSYKNAVIAMNIGDSYKWAKNYNVICRVINNLCDELGLVYMFKQVWHKPYGYNKGNPKLTPLYNYEEIIYFCCSDERPQFNPLGYGDLDKEIETYRTGSRRNPDGKRTEPRMTTNNFYKTFHQSIIQQQFFDTIISVGTDDEHQKLKEATGIDHPALMPLVIPLWPILSFSKPNDVVMDCYSGTATTLCTSLLLGRNAWGIEQEEIFFISSIDRLKSMCQHFNPEDAEQIEQQFCEKFYQDAQNMQEAFIESMTERKAS